MKICSSAEIHNSLISNHRSPWLIALSFLLLLSLAGCGGAAGPIASSSQTPTLQPAQTSDPPAPPPGTDSQTNSDSSSGVPAGAKVTKAIQTLPDWQWCTAKLHGKPCASGLGDATSSMTPGEQDPSLSGSSSKFTLGGHTHYSNALWWKSVQVDGDSTQFVYDLDFYLRAPNAPEALEFDVNQSVHDTRYTWGTECSYRDTGYWDIWDAEHGRWETTSVSCPTVSANQWHHLTWKMERVNGQAHYISITLDGKESMIDKYYSPQQHWRGHGMSVAFQLDGDYRQSPYAVWLDNITLSAW